MTPQQTPTSAFAESLIIARKRMRLSAQKVSDLTEGRVSRNTISNLENGRREDLGLNDAALIAEALTVPLAQMLGQPDEFSEGVRSGMERAISAIVADLRDSPTGGAR